MKKVIFMVMVLLAVSLVFSSNIIKAGFSSSELKSLKEAVEKAKDGDTIVLGGRVFNEKDTIVIKKEITIQGDENLDSNPVIKANIVVEKTNIRFQNVSFNFDKKEHGITLKDTNTKFQNVSIISKAAKALVILNTDPDIVVEFRNANIEGDDGFRANGIDFSNCGTLKIINVNMQEFNNCISVHDVRSKLKVEIKNSQILYSNTGINFDVPSKVSFEKVSLILNNMMFFEIAKKDLKFLDGNISLNVYSENNVSWSKDKQEHNYDN